MSKEQFLRTQFLLGEEGIDTLQKSHVIVFGVGGVGSFAVEALARAGVGKLTLVDFDTVDVTNINRQLIALHSTVGREKVQVLKERLLDINPELIVEAWAEKILPETVEAFFQQDYDYVIDAIDMVSSKLALIEFCTGHHIPIISSMGTGNKLDPSKLTVTDVFKTTTCPLARVMRYELKKRGVKKLQVVYSTESPLKPMIPETVAMGEKRSIPGSTSFVPSSAGLLLASVVVQGLINS
jgi:tRNA A37 threonylcarbamoyladenosine dehydratase